MGYLIKPIDMSIEAQDKLRKQTIERILKCYTCSCCKESYESKDDADECCSGTSKQNEIWERRLDLAHSSISICPHHQ